MLCELVPPLKLAIKERGAPRILSVTCIVCDETFEWTCSQIMEMVEVYFKNALFIFYGNVTEV